MNTDNNNVDPWEWVAAWVILVYTGMITKSNRVLLPYRTTYVTTPGCYYTTHWHTEEQCAGYHKHKRLSDKKNTLFHLFMCKWKPDRVWVCSCLHPPPASQPEGQTQPLSCVALGLRATETHQPDARVAPSFMCCVPRDSQHTAPTHPRQCRDLPSQPGRYKGSK